MLSLLSGGELGKTGLAEWVFASEPARQEVLAMFSKRASILIVFVCLLASLTTGRAALAGTVIFVDASKPGGGNGSTWANAYRYLQDGLSAARASGGTITEIWVAKGTYKPDQGVGFTPGNRNASFSLINNVALRGGFAGNEDPATFNLTDRDFVANQTILSGDLAGDDGPNFANNGENSYHVVTSLQTTSTAVFDGFTISGGNANGTVSPTYYGGGLYSNDGSPTLHNCIFSENSAGPDPAGHGGGLFAIGDGPILNNCAFVGNRAFGTRASGGGMWDGWGGGVTLTNCTFVENTTGNDGTGAGMLATHINATLVNCGFIRNTTGIDGYAGGLYILSSPSTLTNCRFIENGYSDGGGGVCISDSSSTLTNCTFIGNWGYVGGGVGTFSSNTVLANCTFSGNAGSGGCGVYSEDLAPVIKNCIVWGNGNSEIKGPAIVTFSCVQGISPTQGNIASDPKFVSAAAGDVRLGSGSPCIDAGNNADVPGGILFDLAGAPRFFDDPAVPDCQWYPGACGTAPIVDMGAYESIAPPPVITQQPTTQNTCGGETITFTVTAAGTGTLTYQWQKDAVDLIEDERRSGVATSTLTLTSSNLTDAGDYRCIVTDANGSTTSAEAALIVDTTVITQQPVGLTGTPATFSIAATGRAPLTYRWQRNGIDLTDDTHYTGTATPTLTVAYCACGDAAAYRCIVTGPCGSAVSEPATLSCQPGDFDRDTDVDQEDFGVFQGCLGAGLSSQPECGWASLDGTDTVGSPDVLLFAACLSGPQVPADPNCGN